MEQTISAKFKLNYKDGREFAIVFIGATVTFEENENGKWRMIGFDEKIMSIDVCEPAYLKPLSLHRVLRFECAEKISILECGEIDKALEEAAENWASNEYNKMLEQEELERLRSDKRYAQRQRENY